MDDRINAKIADPQKRIRNPMGFLMGFWSGKLPSEWLLNPLSFAWNFRGGVVEAINFTDMTRTTRPGACNFCSKGPPFSTPSTKESNSAKRMGPLCTWRQASSKFLPKAEHLVPETETNSKIYSWKSLLGKWSFLLAPGPCSGDMLVSESLRHPVWEFFTFFHVLLWFGIFS